MERRDTMRKSIFSFAKWGKILESLRIAVVIILLLSTIQLKAQQKNLYQRLGGYDAIAQLQMLL